MLSLLADENFSHRIVRGLRRSLRSLDLVTAQSVGLAGRNDPEVLSWAAANQRVLVTHDVQNIPKFAADRMRMGLPMPGVVVVPERLGIGVAISDLQTVIECAEASELANVILFLPLNPSLTE